MQQVPRARHILRFTLLAALLTGYFTYLGFSRWYSGLVTSYDMGIFSQSAKSYAHGHLPVSHIRNLPLLGDHFSPVNAVLGVAWRVWPDPRVLVLVQAFCLALALTGVLAWLGATGARARWLAGLATVALVSRGVLSVALFDFHEVAFAAPATVLLCWGVATRRPVAVAVGAVVLALTKEDLGMTIVGAAAAMLVQRPRWRWQAVAATAAFGVAALVVSSLVIAHVNPLGKSPYLDIITQTFSGGATECSAQHVCGLHPAERLRPVMVLLAASLVVGLRSPLMLIALPTVGWRVVSSSSHYWSIDFHYDLVPTLVAFCAVADAWGWARRQGGIRRRTLMVGGVLAGLLSMGLGVQVLFHRYPPLSANEPPPSRVKDVQALVARMPREARVAALNSVGPYAVSRTDVYSLKPDTATPVRYALFPTDGFWQADFPDCDRQTLIRRAGESGGSVTKRGDVVLVDFGRPERIPALLRGACGRP